MTRRHIAVIVLLLSPLLVFSQAGGPAIEQLRQGLQLFQQERYPDAAQVFRAVIANPQAGSARPEAYYWAARSFAAVDQLGEAEQHLEQFLASYPSHPLYPDALYQKGRLMYLQGDADSAIQVLGAYVDQYPSADLVSSGYFWIAEALYSLGQIDEAGRIYGKIVAEYPKSVKLEAARYRLSLIEFKQREEELLRLLQWSHQEALKAVEEFQRRERAYEQALAAYRSGLAPAAAPGGSAGVESLQREKAALEARVQQLEARVAAAEAAAQTGSGTREELLRTLAEALEVKQALLNKLAEQVRKPE